MAKLCLGSQFGDFKVAVADYTKGVEGKDSLLHKLDKLANTIYNAFAVFNL